MIQWGNIPTYIPQTALFTVPQVQIPYSPAQMPSVFSYNPFGSLTSGYNLQSFTPTPQGISSYNPFNWFNFSMPNWFSNFSFPTFNLTDSWNKIKITAGKAYNSAKETGSKIVTNVKDFASGIVSRAKKYLGYNEKDGSYKKFTDGRTEAWCADFATYVARECGANIPHFSGVSQILDWGNKNNKFSKTAKVGDLIIFKGVDKRGKRVSHTGIVTKVENGKVYTIEGNTSKGDVAERSCPLNDSRISGYVTVA